MRFLLLLLVLFGASPVLANTCLLEPQQLVANYKVIQHSHAAQQAKNKITLIRDGNQLIHLFNDKGYGDLWSKSINDQLMLTRFFPKYQRSIEYQAEDLTTSRKNKYLWQQKTQMISPELLKKMTIMRTEGTGCKQVDVLTYQHKGKKYLLRWLPKLALVEYFDILKGDMKLMSWQLESVTNISEEYGQLITDIQHYQSTDYIDIGDNESDPFLAKMINQGFVSQSEAGFYNSLGKNITPQHGHRH